MKNHLRNHFAIYTLARTPIWYYNDKPDLVCKEPFWFDHMIADGISRLVWGILKMENYPGIEDVDVEAAISLRGLFSMYKEDVSI